MSAETVVSYVDGHAIPRFPCRFAPALALSSPRSSHPSLPGLLRENVVDGGLESRERVNELGLVRPDIPKGLIDLILLKEQPRNIVSQLRNATSTIS